MEHGALRYHFPGRTSPMPHLQGPLLFLAFGAFIAAVQWHVPHTNLWLMVSAFLGCLAAILWIPTVILGDQPVPESTFHLLREESARFRLVEEAWEVVCDKEHPTWTQLEAIVYWVRHVGVPILGTAYWRASASYRNKDGFPENGGKIQ